MRHGASTIDLSTVESFTLGSLRVQPTRRLVSWSGGHRELEPRVLKVLLVLARAQGEVVSRDRLIELCWDGRIVGDDAINRCIQQLRRLTRDIDPPPFTIETVARVGYCLLSPSSSASSADQQAYQQPSAPPVRFGGRRKLWFGALLVLLLGGASAALVLRGPAISDKAPHRISVEAEDQDTASLARDLMVDLARLAGTHADDMHLVPPGERADLVTLVSLSRAGNSLIANLTLRSSTGKEILWSDVVEVPEDQRAALRPQLAGRLGAVLICASSLPRGRELDATTAKLFVKACERSENPFNQQQLAELQQVTRQAPTFAPALALLSRVQADLIEAEGVGGGAAPSPEQVRIAREQILKARSLDPALGDTYAAEAALLPRHRWTERIAVLERGLAHDPENPALPERLSLVLIDVGRMSDAIEAAARSAELRPLSSRSRSAFILNLAHAGNLERARRELTEAERLWPASEDLLATRFSIELRYGDPRVAQQMLDRADASLGGPTGGFGGPQILMKARLDPTPANIARMVDFVSRQARRLPMAVPLRIQALGHADATNEAYAMMEQPGVIDALRGATSVLFRPHLRSFREDRRFMPLAHRLGLVDYWLASGEWPDFCADPRLPYDCQTEARRLRE